MTSTVSNFSFLRQKEVKHLVHGHTAGKWQSQDLSISRSILEASSLLPPGLAA